MRKWQDLAPPDDPGSWYDIDGMCPTPRGSYQSFPIVSSGTSYTATSVGTVTYAFYGQVPNPNTVNAEYVIDGSKIWRYDVSSTGTEMSDKTGGVTVGVRQKMAQYGTVTVCVMGSPRGALSGNATVYAVLGNNFAALTNAPMGDCVCVESNAVIIANTDTANDAWEASDVGDYTNWTSGEWASGRVYQPPGPIKAAVPLNGAVYLFKSNSIHRMRYVGGSVKWSVEKVFEGIGCGLTNAACAGLGGILFLGESGISATGTPANNFYWFDGVSAPVLVNPYTSVGTTSFANASGVKIQFNRYRNLFTICEAGNKIYTYLPEANAWGKSTVSYASGVILLDGDSRSQSMLVPGWIKSAANTLVFYNPSVTIGAGARYIQTSLMGAVDSKTQFSRLIPLLRRRVDLGTDSASLTADFYRERHDTTAASSLTVAEASSRKRFDFNQSDNFARFKVTYTDLDIEIDDVLVKTRPAGTD